jgi:hypothetical protein
MHSRSFVLGWRISTPGVWHYTNAAGEQAACAPVRCASAMARH